VKSVIILLIIVAAKAVFSAADTAFTYTSKFKISQESKKNIKARQIKKMLEDKNRVFEIIEVGIIMAELFASAFVAEVYLGELSSFLIKNGIEERFAIVLATIIITVVLSYILLVFGGVLPKKIARNNPERTAYRLIGILQILAFINMPFEKLIKLSINIFSKALGLKEEKEDKLTEREIKMIIAEGKDQGIVNQIEKEIATKALRFNEIAVKEIMILKENIKFINIKESSDRIIEDIRKCKFTRIPVFEGTRDNIIGILNIKDLILGDTVNIKKGIKLNELLRQVIVVPKETKISEVFKIMKSNRQGMVLIEDKDKKIVGLATMEDILERLVGKIFDEYDVVRK
jgi:putative hemolysin